MQRRSSSSDELFLQKERILDPQAKQSTAHTHPTQLHPGPHNCAAVSLPSPTRVHTLIVRARSLAKLIPEPAAYPLDLPSPWSICLPPKASRRSVPRRGHLMHIHANHTIYHCCIRNHRPED